MSAIGAGGMGQVYRARDTRLNRDVAIKVLPELFALDPDRRARFEREAQAVAALSHPNILAIHDFGSAGSLTYAVMELLDGETLRERLTSGPLPIRKAVDYAVQIVRGLSAAHDKGIVHRDLKPENIFITSDSHVKILDFGLARHVLAPSSSDQTVSVATEPGIVMGSAGYMSPEQVRGANVDHRSDLFAFGAVLYEMLTGRRAFGRDTAAETMTAILKEDPPDLAESGRAIPPAIDDVIRHCLEKRPEERFQSARDLGFALQHVDSGSVPVITKNLTNRRVPALLGLAGAAVVAVAAFMWGRWMAPAAPSNEWRNASFKQVTVTQDPESWPALSPDGKSVVFAGAASGNSDIYVQRVGGHNATNLTPDSPDIDDQPAFSPDGSLIAFHSTRGGGGIFVMGSTGESVRRVADSGFNPAWSPDGRSLAIADTTFEVPQSRPGFGKLRVVALADGSRRDLPTGDAVQPSWSPDGSRIAYWSVQAGGRRDIFTIAADGSGAPVAVTDDAALDWNPVWSHDGRHLYFSSDRGGTMSIWRVPIDQRSGRVGGEPESIVVPASTAGSLSLSHDGRTMLYATAAMQTTLFVAPYDPGASVIGPPQVLIAGAQQIDYIDVSPDGKWVVFGTADRQEDLFLLRTDGTGFRQLTDDEYRDRGPRWSPDGSRLMFYSNRTGPYNLWSIRPDGSRLEIVARSSQGLIRPAWAPDGRRVMAKNFDRGSLIMVDLEKPIEQRVQELKGSETLGLIPQAWSPDGRFVVAALESGAKAPSLFMVTPEGQVRQMAVGSATWEGALAWLPDSSGVLFGAGGTGINLLDARTGKVRQVAARPRVDIPALALSRDGRTIVFTEMRMAGDLWIMEKRR
jgi:serine/threonine protein kinase